MTTSLLQPSLSQVQRSIQGFLLNPARDIGLVKGLVKASSRAPQDLRLGVYAEAYSQRLLEALATDYDGLKSYLGDEQFAQFIRVYIEQHPSRHFSLRWLGAQLPDFIATTPPYSEHPELVDLANFEWAQCHAFDAADVVPIELSVLANLSGEQWLDLQLQLHPSVQLLRLGSNAPAIWSALSENAEPPELQLFSQPKTWLVWRQDLRLLFRELPAPEAYAIAQFAGDKSFAEVCDDLNTFMPEAEVPGYAAGLLRRWIEAGLIAAIEISVGSTIP